MEDASLPILNLIILGSVFLFGLRELGKLQTQAIRVEEEQDIRSRRS